MYKATSKRDIFPIPFDARMSLRIFIGPIGIIKQLAIVEQEMPPRLGDRDEKKALAPPHTQPHIQRRLDVPVRFCLNLMQLHPVRRSVSLAHTSQIK